jgi:hypothetical protein
MSRGELLISPVRGIVTARGGRLPDAAVVWMFGRRFMGLWRVRFTPGSMRSKSVMRRAGVA